MKIKVEVSSDDIACGEPNNCRSCPVARAITRALVEKFPFDKGYDVLVTVEATNVEAQIFSRKMSAEYPNKYIFDAYFPTEVSKWIAEFDTSKKRADIEPIAFEVDLTGVLTPK